MKIFCPYAAGALNVKMNTACVCFKSKDKTPVESIDNIDSLVNNPQMNKVRLGLVNGVWPEKNCVPCKQVEAINGRSARTKIIGATPDNIKEWLIDNIDSNGNIKNILYLELRLRNSCNLACRHCDSEYSSQWNTVVDQLNQLGKQPYYEKTEKSASISKQIPIEAWIDFIKNQIDADVFDKNPDLLFYLEFTGGEPFFQKEFYEFLTELEKFPEYKKRIELGVTTNGIIANRFRNYSLEKLLSGFGRLALCVSLDASKNFYEYFRQNGNWGQATTQILSLANNISNTKILFSISPTVFQCLRFTDMYNDFNQLLGYNLKPKNIIISDIHNPFYLRVENIHPDLKAVLIDEIKKAKSDINDPAFDKLVDLSLKQLSKPGDINEWNSFCDMTFKLDKKKKKNVFDYFPELKQYWIL